MRIEHTQEGVRQFVSTARSGRRYVGSTPEEAERKHLLAFLHAAERENGIARDLAESQFGTRSFGHLTIEQMRSLKNQFVASRQAGKELEKNQRLEPGMTQKQRARIIKLGLYVLAPYYGKDWFWRKCKEWVVRFHHVARIDLDDLTNQEAWYVIQRLERIEKRLKTHGVLDEE